MRGCDFIRIHTVRAGERISDIAEIYGIKEELIRRTNAITKEPATGEQLLILTPTRTYTPTKKDTPDQIALRFGISRHELLAKNPDICERGLVSGEAVAVKYSDPIYGMGAANGYFYKGCTISEMRRALPYLTYVTVAAANEHDGEISQTIDDREVVEQIVSSGKIPLLRIYYYPSEREYTKEHRERLCENIISAAKHGGYAGVVLSERDHEGYAELLVELRRKMIGSDLILITEISEDSAREASEYADGSIMSYDKYAHLTQASLNDGERRIFSDFACSCEGSKTFISLPALAAWGRGYCTVTDALEVARQYGCEIHTDKDSLISSFNSARRGEVRFSSLENIKAILDLINEYGYMGVSFDIMRTPITHFLMYNHLFRTVTHARVRSAEGCSER